MAVTLCAIWKKTFNELYHFFDSNGVYIVEDTHTCYWEEYQGGLGKNSSFIEVAKRLVDHLNAVHTREQIPISSFTKETFSICFYDSIVVFEKSPQANRKAPKTGRMIGQHLDDNAYD